MENNEISIHEVRIVEFMRKHGGWLTNHAIADATKMSNRTVRAHTRRLARLGVVDQAEVFPGHRFKWSEMASKRNNAYTIRLERAAEVFAE